MMRISVRTTLKRASVVAAILVFPNLALEIDVASADVSCRASSNASKRSNDYGYKMASLTVKFDQVIESGPTPYIYVNGKMAGAVPGTVLIPLEPKETAVEIGLPLLKEVPLYSFVIGPAEIDKSTANIILSTFKVEKPASENIWSAVTLNPNELRAVKLARESANLYTIELPATSYRAVAEFWKRQGVESHGIGWVSAIPQANNKSFAGGVDHVAYNESTKTVEALYTERGQGKGEWSGAYQLVSAPGSFVPKKDWTISSIPSGAGVRTLRGPVNGTTTVTVPEVPVDEMDYIVVQMNGYLDCNQAECDRSETRDRVSLHCQLSEKAN